jgi:signal recognition particle subunit SRP54
MTGQDAVRSAAEFEKRVGITGIVLSKLDGDARGGAALSAAAVTGRPVKFAAWARGSTISSRSTRADGVDGSSGWATCSSLIERAEEAFDREQALESSASCAQRVHARGLPRPAAQMKKMGPLEQVLAMLPGVGQLKRRRQRAGEQRDEAAARDHRLDDADGAARPGGAERQPPQAHRQGSGTSVEDVNRLLKQFVQARKMMKSFAGRRRQA